MISDEYDNKYFAWRNLGYAVFNDGYSSCDNWKYESVGDTGWRQQIGKVIY